MAVSPLQIFQNIAMAYRRLASVGKSINLKQQYKSFATVPRNHNDFFDLECHYRSLPASATHTHFFLRQASALPKDKIDYCFSNLSMVKNMSTLPQGKGISSGKIEPEDPSEITKTLNGDNVGRGGEDKRLMDIAVDIKREMVEAEEKLNEGHMLLEEIVGELKGFIALLRWNVRQETVNRVNDILDDVDSRNTKAHTARLKLYESIEERISQGGVIQEPYADKIKSVTADSERIQERMIGILQKCKKMTVLLCEMVEKRTRMLFYLSFLFGGR